MEISSNDSGFVGSAEPSPASFAAGSTDVQMMDGSSGMQQIITIPYNYSAHGSLPIQCIISNNDQRLHYVPDQQHPICVLPQSLFPGTVTPDQIRQIQTPPASNLVTMQSVHSDAMSISSAGTPDSACFQFPAVKVEGSTAEQCLDMQIEAHSVTAPMAPRLPQHGCTPPPPQELDLANISTSGGYFSKENLRANQMVKHVNYNFASNHMRQVQRQLSQKRGVESTPPRQALPPSREHTPSPPPPPMLNLKEELNTNSDSPTALLLGEHMQTVAAQTPTVIQPAQHLSVPGSSTDGAPHHRIVVNLPGGSQSHPTAATTTTTTTTASNCYNPTSPLLTLNSPAPTSSPNMNYPMEPKTSTPAHFIKKEFDPGPMDDSLTNIQWLGAMSGRKLVNTKSPHCAGTSPVISADSLLRDLNPASVPTTAVRSAAKPVAPKTAPPNTYIVTNGSQLVSSVGAGLPVIFDGSVPGLSDPSNVETYSVGADRDVRIIASEKQIDKISRECGSKKRPPYSYMHLIQMAISSRVDKKMTLREIYKWIEDKFPYYKHSVKGGWKNSIRHNLSLYNIFVRQKSNVPGQTGSSYWTLKLDAASKPIKPVRVNSPQVVSADDGSTNCGSTVVQVVGSGGSSSPQIVYINNNMAPAAVNPKPSYINKPKKGPPLLPKPPPMQTYALIPIQNGMPVLQPQPVLISSMSMPSPATAAAPISTQACTVITQASSLISSVATASHGTCTMQVQQNPSASGSALKRLRSTHETYSGPQKKLPKIFPKASILGRRSSSFSGRPVPTSAMNGSSLDTSDLQCQMSSMKVDSGLNSDLNMSENSQELPEASLPKPKMYRHKKPRKEKQQCRLDSSEKERVLSVSDKSLSESGFQDIVASIEKDLTSPVRSLLRTPPPKEQNRSLLTSTPTQGLPCSPGSWISPINGPTPSTDGRNDYLDSGFFTPDSRISFSTPNKGVILADGSSKPGKLNISPKVGSLSALGLPGLTPLKMPQDTGSPRQSPNGSFNISNQSFTRLLGDFHLDSMIEEGFPTQLDISHLIFGNDESS